MCSFVFVETNPGSSSRSLLCSVSSVLSLALLFPSFSGIVQRIKHFCSLLWQTVGTTKGLLAGPLFVKKWNVFSLKTGFEKGVWLELKHDNVLFVEASIEALNVFYILTWLWIDCKTFILIIIKNELCTVLVSNAITQGHQGSTTIYVGGPVFLDKHLGGQTLK